MPRMYGSSAMNRSLQSCATNCSRFSDCVPNRSSPGSTSGSPQWRNPAWDISTGSIAWSACASNCPASLSPATPIVASACQIVFAPAAKPLNSYWLRADLRLRSRTLFIDNFAMRILRPAHLRPEHGFFYQLENNAPVLRDHLHPRELAHHGEINSAETQARDQNVDAVPHRLIVQRIDGVGHGFRTIGLCPSVFH